MQNSYDTKLKNATYDALKAFQLNTVNSDTSDISDSKLRDIEASVNTFFNSIASNFNMAGYNKDILSDYVPALVYTMYDGYYIYSPYTNVLDNTNSRNYIINDETGETRSLSDAQILSKDYNSKATYKEGDRITGLKPYIHYSCRYKRGNDDFVITYSLDNYITIQGQINDEAVNDSGYLLDNIRDDGNMYREVTIDKNDKVDEYIDDTDKPYECIKINGVKYYKDHDDGDDSLWFTILNGKKSQSLEKFSRKKIEDNKAAILYYKEALEFTTRVREKYKLNTLNPSNDAVDEEGNQLFELDEKGEKTSNPKFGNYKIFFKDENKSIEDPDSNFNDHRLAVIRYAIEKNLSIAIANYNNYSGVSANFQMPVLKEDEWDKIVNNVSIISFLQGLNIGGKMYNGYSIITNNKNKEVVSEDSIYIVKDNQYYRANDNDLKDAGVGTVKGVLNIDFERKSIVSEDGVTRYYFPHKETGSYSSIVTQTNANPEAIDNFYKYMAKNGDTALARAYFTALGRERYGMYKTGNDREAIKAKFK